MHIHQYFPAFFEGFEPWDGDVANYGEFLKIPFVARFDEEVPGFLRFKATEYTPDHLCISAVLDEYEAGEKSFVIAFATGPDRRELLKGIYEPAAARRD